MLQANIGSTDRVVRIVVGLVLLAYAIPIGFPVTGWNWVGWIGLVPILTAVVRLPRLLDRRRIDLLQTASVTASRR